MVSLKVPEDLDKCIVILDAETEDDLETPLQGLGIDVPPRAQDPATDVREQWQIHHLLRALLAARQLSAPVRLYKRESPDFVLQNGILRIGIEAREAVNRDYVRAQVHPAAQRDGAVVDPSLYKWGTEGRPRSQIREEAGRTQLSGYPWTDDSVEQEFAQSIRDVVLTKDSKLRSLYARFDSDRLLIYHSQPSPLIHIDKARLYTADILADYWNRFGFDTVYVHKYNWMLSFTKDRSEIVYKFPQSDAPFGIDAHIWEQLESVEKIYLKLLEDEPHFVSYGSISEPVPEPDDLFGLESELHAISREWIANRDRDLARMGCTTLLQPPGRIRLRTASEIAAFPPTVALFRGGVLEHVFRAFAELVPDAAIAGLQRAMESRAPEFAATLIAVLRYLSRFNEITHWASDARKCSAILDVIDPHA